MVTLKAHFARRTIRNRLVINLVRRQQETERVLATALRQPGELQRELKALKRQAA